MDTAFLGLKVRWYTWSLKTSDVLDLQGCPVHIQTEHADGKARCSFTTQHPSGLLHQTAAGEDNTETLLQFLSISEFQMPPVPTLCCGPILTCPLRAVSHKKDGLAPDTTQCPILKTPSFLKRPHSMHAPYLSEPNGLIWLKALLSLAYQLSFSSSCHKKYFYVTTTLQYLIETTINSWCHLVTFKIH